MCMLACLRPRLNEDPQLDSFVHSVLLIICMNSVHVKFSPSLCVAIVSSLPGEMTVSM